MAEYIERESIKKSINSLLDMVLKFTHSPIEIKQLVFDVIDEERAAVVQPARWISVEDRQPKCIHGSSDSVLVCRDNGECEVAYLVYDNDDGFYWYTQDERSAFEFEEVTHWMPLPEPPQD